MSGNDQERGANFIQAQVERDLVTGRYGGRVATRFPPEPNGYPHIGHAKSICLNFGLARRYGGTCNLRYDDTNPTTEDQEYVDAILRDVRWLGFEPDAVLYASDYYEQLYQWAEKLIRDGKAYVDDQSLEEIRAARGSVTEPGTPSPWRDRSVEENLRLFREMRAGVYDDGSKVLRGKADMSSVNMKMRDPLMYRIRRAHHYRTGDKWCIYPMYDWAHGQCDAIERITHSICTLEFENNRELYDWFLHAIGQDALGTEQIPNQYEFARLDLSYTVVSKRKLLRLVKEGHVDGWDDPRMPTIAGMRRRGITPEAIREFAERIGVARAQSTVDVGVLESAIRDDLHVRAPRRMVVLDPLRVELTNVDGVTSLTAPSFPPDAGMPETRAVPIGREILIERADFAEVPPKGFRRLVPGGEVRLRYGWVIRCDEVIKDEAGQVVALRCSADLDTLGVNPAGRSVKGTIHWVPADAAVPLTVRLYDRLFRHPAPDAAEGDFLDHVNPDSLRVLTAYGEPALADDEPGGHYQMERHAYVYRAPEDAAAGLVLNRVVSLKDSWATEAVVEEEVAEVEADPRATAEAQARIKADARAAKLSRDEALSARYEALLAVVGGEEEAFRLAEEPARAAWLHGAVGAGAPGPAAARWILNILLAEAKDGLDALPFDAGTFGRLVGRVEGGLSVAAGKKVLAAMIAGGGEPDAIISKLGLDAQVDEAAAEALVSGVLAGLPAEVARYRAGEAKLLGFLTGQVMKAAKGVADPAVVQRLLKAQLG